MKKSFKILFAFSSVFLLLLGNKVYANTYDTSFKTTANSTLKSGDIIELQAGIGCASNEYPVTQQNFTFLYDSNVFELVYYNDDTWHKIRDGWNEKSSGIAGNGKLFADVEASSGDYYITENVASDNCLDSTNAVLVTFKLKVKNTSNQNTKLQLINEISYVKELNFTIHNNSSNNYLSSLKVEGYDLDESFNKNKNEYEVYVPYSIEKVNIIASTEDSSASVSGTGENQLKVGDNKINLVVTAENGAKNIYTINVIRKNADDDTSLSKVLVTDSNKNKVVLSYDEKTKTYTGIVSSEITFVSFDVKCSGEDCFVDELASESVKEGRNEFKFFVVSQNGDKEEYKIIINKEEAKKVNLILYLSISLGICALLCVILLILYLKNKNK